MGVRGTHLETGRERIRRVPHEAGDALALARSRLAGVKLLLLAVAWVCALGVMNILVYGRAPELPGGQTMRMAAEWLAGFACPVVAEFVSPDDPTVGRLTANKRREEPHCAQPSNRVDSPVP